ncbi:hypothetical protein ACJ41O_012348 [Fusarium nematophilum]
MAAQADHVLLRPFNDVIKWARLAALQASDTAGDDRLRASLNRSGQSLLREGERALRRLTPFLERPPPHLSDFLRDLTLRHDDVIRKVRAIDILLYDFEDFIDLDTFDKAKFDDLQTATKDLAITLVERITRFTTEAALDSPPPSKFPPLPPLPPLPPVPNVPRPGSQMSSRPATSASPSFPVPNRVQRRPSQGKELDTRFDSRSAGRPARPVGYPASTSPVSPTSLPFSNQSMVPEQENARYDYYRNHHRQLSNSEILALGTERLDIRALTPPSSTTNSQSPFSYQSPPSSYLRDSGGYNYQESPPPSLAADPTPEHEISPILEHPAASRNLSFASAGIDGRTSSFNDYHDSRQYDYRGEPAEQYRASVATQGTGPSSRSDGSDGPALRPGSISSGTTTRTADSASVKSGQSSRKVTGCEIGPESSLSLLGGFCKGARAFVSGGPGRAIRKVGGSANSGESNKEYSQEMLFGQMLATSTEAYSEPTAQCLHCEYKSPYSHLLQDMDQDPLANQQSRGVVYRSRFLYKSHIAVRGVHQIYFGCLFCDKAKATHHEGDATVFQTIDLLFRHISRHVRPLPHVPGVNVAYDNVEIGSRGRQDYDLFFPSSNPPVPYLGLPAGELDRIASLPVARATKDHIRRRNEKPQARPDSVSEVLQFMAGARILGVEFPEKWDGKWCQGWHDGAFGTFPSKIIQLELPLRVNITSLPKTPRTGVARWKFEVKAKPGSGWLPFSKGETIYNLAWDDPHGWFWSGSNARGQTGIFPKSHIGIESIQDGSLQNTRRKQSSGEKSRFGSLFGKSR